MSTLKYLLAFLVASNSFAETLIQEASPAPEINPAAQADPLIIDALVLYSPGAAELYDGDPSTRIDHLFAIANTAYANSGLNTKLSLVDAQLYELDDSLSPTSVLSASIQDEVLKEKRDEAGADVVILYRPNLHDGICGITFMGGEASRSNLAIAHVSIDCGAMVTVHELGHIMGLGHSHRQNSLGIFPHATGYGVDATFTTLMAYPGAFNNAPTQLNFSSPDLLCSGLACGIPVGQENPADAVLALKTTQNVVADYREHIEVELAPVAVIPPSALDIAQQAYEDYLLTYDEIKSDLLSAKSVLRDRFYEQLHAFRTYLSARIQHYRVKNREGVTAEEIQTAATNSKDAKATYRAAKALRKEALTTFRHVWFDQYLPSLSTLSELRLNYLIEKAREEEVEEKAEEENEDDDQENKQETDAETTNEDDTPT